MGRLAEVMELKSPPERVWEVLRDAGLRPRWEVGVVRVEDVTGALDQEGTTWTEVRALAGVKMRERWRVVRVEPLRSLELTGTHRAADASRSASTSSRPRKAARSSVSRRSTSSPVARWERCSSDCSCNASSNETALVADERFRALAE